ncbi:MAG TPA: serine hydrolase domain-containing protein [Cyclobacteriaceae bacterium]|nr:serine hydrolase domain-containing protein [Cyclobacteriaceae bacterium]
MVKHKKLIILSLVVIALPLLIANYFYTKPVPPPPAPKPKTIPKAPVNPLLSEVLSEYETSIDELLEETGIPGASIAIVRDTTVVYMKGFGVKTINTNDSIDIHTVFRIGSVSKCFAGMLTAILVEEGTLCWDDPVIKYVPDFKLKSPEQTEKLTIRNVLSHTTGLPYHTYTTLVEDGLDLKTMLNRLQEINDGPVGKIYSYQNVAFSLISEIVCSATGKTYEALVQEKIFDPLKMRDASLSYDELMSNGNIAHPHLRRRRSWREVPIKDTYYNVAPAGGVNASIADMTAWMQALLGNRPDIISQKSLDQIYTPVVSATTKNRSYRKIGRIKKNYYGLGWRILYFPADTVIYHGGYVNGFRSEVAIYPKDKIAICILANAPGDVTDTGIPIFLKEYLDRRDTIESWEMNWNKIAFR